MPWVRIDDDFLTNPKTRGAGPDGRELFLSSWLWCAKQLNDGLFRAEDLPVIAALAEVPSSVGERLVAVKLWHPEGYDCPKCRGVEQTMPVPAGYIAVHEYLERNPSRQQVIADREAAAERQRKSREKSRRDSHRTNGETSAAPSPSPDEFSVSQSSSDLHRETPPVDNSTDDDEVPAQVWEEYARLKLAQQPDGKVKNQTKWLETARANARTEHGETALRWWREFDVRPHVLAAWLVDGQPSRNAERRKENT